MFLKRLIDVIVSAGVLLLLLPLLVLIAAVVYFCAGSPVFYSQVRVGRAFRNFRIWKFRSMRTDSCGPPITVAGDTRVTRVGAFLRTTKLDELPQFWNVLRGDMSLVGPRPEVPAFVHLFKDRYETVLSIRPGITDLASIRFCNEETALAGSADPQGEYIRRVLPLKLDLADEYVRNRSLRLDFSILLHTLVVLKVP